MYQQSSSSTNVQVGFCGFLILTIVGNGFQTCGELFQAARAHMDCSSLSLFPRVVFFPLLANLREDAHWGSPAIYLRQPGNKEQNRAVPAPVVEAHLGGQSRATRASQQLPPLPHSWGTLKIKIPFNYLLPCLPSACTCLGEKCTPKLSLD